MWPNRLYILGSRGIPASHGGFETFAQDLALYLTSQGTDVTVYCQSDKNKEDFWNGIHRISIKAPDTVLGTALFDLKCIWDCLSQPDGIWLTLGHNTGLLNFLPRLFGKKQIINMDGIEWRRAKWSWPYKTAFLFNYFCAGFAGNVLIADNPGIEDLLKKHFRNDKIKMIAYGAEAVTQADPKELEAFGLKPQDYALIIARPEPENSLFEIVSAWSTQRRNKKLVVLGRLDPSNAYHVAAKNASSSEVLFLGAIYNTATVSALRYHAWVYFHGHTVGGTNPSLVEALAAGNTVIAHDNVFNRWTAGEAGYYFSSVENLAKLLDKDLPSLGDKARARHQAAFRQEYILGQYADLMAKLQAGSILSKPCATML